MQLRNKHAILIAIVVAQFLCTSLWFATNGVLDELILAFSLPASSLGHLTTAVQAGFITGTLVFALLNTADRYSPSRVFLFSAIIGAIANAAIVYEENELWSILALRFLTGFFLAGVYPVGMKIAADYFDQSLGKVLGWLVGALVLGTALPHLLNFIGAVFDWQDVLLWISLLSAMGGLVIGIFVKDGPFRQRSSAINLKAAFRVFRIRSFRKPALGYFGHMWELYALWAFIPVSLAAYAQLHQSNFSISCWTFIIIGAGGFGCVQNGYLSMRIGAGKAAMIALAISGFCCVLSPFLMTQASLPFFLLFMIIWGITVVADSPMFSSLVAKEAPVELRGTGLTIVVCIGFAITIVSIQLLNWMQHVIGMEYLFLLLAPGPILGLLSMIIKPGKA